MQFAYLRQDVFNYKSYLYVFVGVVLYSMAEGMLAIRIFKFSLPLQDFLIMVFYGIAVYLIVLGVINEKEIEQEQVEKFDDKINVL